MVPPTAAPSDLLVIRHGSTAWSSTGRHTGRTDVPLLPEGLVQAHRIGPLVHHLLGATHPGAVFSSPLARARDTALAAGFPAPTLLVDAQEWDYGAYEGLTQDEIRKSAPEWTIWKDGPLHGETLGEVAERAQRVLRILTTAPKPTLLFSHGHFLRILATQWIDADAHLAERLLLRPAAVSILGSEHNVPAISRWNISAE